MDDIMTFIVAGIIWLLVSAGFLQIAIWFMRGSRP
jgi:hypothetical protein